METKIKIGQIYKFNRKSFEGDVFLDCQNDQNTDSTLIAAAVIKSADKTSIKKIFGGLSISFFSSYPTPLQATLMEERLSALNREIEEKINSPKKLLKQTSCLLAEINGDTLSVAGIGDTAAYILRKNKWYKLILAKTARESETFSSFTTGKIMPGDSVLLSTTSLFNFLSLETIKKILSADTGQEAAGSVLELIKYVVPKDEPVMGMIVSFVTSTNELASPVKVVRKRWKKYRFPALVTSGLAMLIAATFFAGGHALESQQQKNQRDQLGKLENVESDLTNAEAALIYRDYEKARQLLTRTQIDLKQIYASKTSPQVESRWLNLRKKWEKLSNTLSE